MTNYLNIDWDLFCSNQNYHDTILNHDKPQCYKYYDVVEQCPNFNTFVLVNMMTKIYALPWGNTYSQTLMENLADKFTHIFITQDLFFELLDRIVEHRHFGAFGKLALEKAVDGETLRRGLFMVNILLKKCTCGQLNINNFIQYVQNNYTLYYHEKPYKKQNVLTTVEIVKSICQKIIKSNPLQQINLNVMEYMLESNLFVDCEPETQEQYRLLFKYQKKVNKNPKFSYDIECLENACTIPNNETVVSKLMKSINPNSQCLSNALAHPDNKVIPIILAKVNPSLEQILAYCSTQKNSIMEALVTKYAEGLNG